MSRYLIFFILLSCIPTTYLKNDPLWNIETCEPQDRTFLSWADEIKEKDIRIEEIPLGVEKALKVCTNELEKLNYTFAYKPGGLGDFEHYTTTIPGINLVWLPPTWDEKSIGIQALIMCHEWIHGKTETRLKLEGSISHYLTIEGRLAFELPAYGLDLDLQRRWDNNLNHLKSSAEHYVSSLHKGYLMQSVPKRCLRKIAFEYWNIGS